MHDPPYYFESDIIDLVTTLAKAQVAILGKGLRRSKGIMQLVKRKDTGMYLHYLCESIVQQRDIYED